MKDTNELTPGELEAVTAGAEFTPRDTTNYDWSSTDRTSNSWDTPAAGIIAAPALTGTSSPLSSNNSLSALNARQLDDDPLDTASGGYPIPAGNTFP